MIDPILLQVNARFWLSDLSRALGRQATLDDIPDAELLRLKEQGFDWLYLLGVWQTGAEEARLARQEASLQREAARLLGFAGDRAVCASCFAICGYQAPEAWGGDEALRRLHQRMHSAGLKLMLDFIPNHTGVSHPWAHDHPEYYLTAPQEGHSPAKDACTVQTAAGPRRLMHGRDPYFPPWSDTLQLNYANPDLQQAVREELEKAAGFCDGLRCDMAMLVLPEVFRKTWGQEMAPFWPAALQAVRKSRPDFVFLAEVYWDLEAALIEQGFDFAYDKRLYDALRAQDAAQAIGLTHHRPGLQPHLAHFLENHDESRAAAVFPFENHQVSALVSYCLPGLRFFQEGQLEGHNVRAPVQFCQPPPQQADPRLSQFYAQLLGVLAEMGSRRSQWAPVAAQPAWEGNPSWQSLACFAWQAENGSPWLLAANLSAGQSQARLPLPFAGLAGRGWRLDDRMNAAAYLRSGDELANQGLYVDLPAWGCHLFRCEPLPTENSQ